MFRLDENLVITQRELSHSEYDRQQTGNPDIFLQHYFQQYIENVVSEFITAFKSGAEENSKFWLLMMDNR